MVARVDHDMIAGKVGPDEVRKMSATPESMLVDSEQLIADLHRQLAECRAERDEALQRETATAEVLQVINSSPSDLAPVFDAILDKALRLCGAAYGALRMWDGEHPYPGRLAGSAGVRGRFTKGGTGCTGKFGGAICSG